MDKLDQRRLEHSEQTLGKGRAALATDPSMGLYWVKSGLRLKATTLTKLESAEADDAIHELVSEGARMHSELGLPIAPAEKNEFVVLALSLGHVELAKQIVRIQSTLDEYPFTQVLEAMFAQLLGLPTQVPMVPRKLTAAEQYLIDDLENIIEGKQATLGGADKFWSATRKKSYANTIHEHRNFFKPALAVLQGI